MGGWGELEINCKVVCGFELVNIGMLLFMCVTFCVCVSVCVGPFCASVSVCFCVKFCVSVCDRFVRE